MKGAKAKALRRMYWTDRPNGRSRTMRALKAEFKKGVAINGYAYYPRKGRDWRELLA